MEGEALIRKLVRRLLVHGMCLFEDEIKTAVREALLKRRCGESKKRSLLLDTALIFAITNRASPLYSQKKTGKNSNHNSVRVLAW